MTTMMNNAESALAIRLSSDAFNTLPNLHPHFTVFQPQQSPAPPPPPPPPNSTSNPVSNINTTPPKPHNYAYNNGYVYHHSQSSISWIRNSRTKAPPIHGPFELSSAIRSLRPSRIYVILPCIPVDVLPPNLIAPLLQAEQALRHARISPPSPTPLHSSTQSTHALRVTANPTCRVTLIFDGNLDRTNVDRYDALFQPHEALSAYAAASVLLSRIQDITHISSLTRWSGSVYISPKISASTLNSNNNQYPCEFPGFHLITSSSSDNKENIHLPLSVKTARYAHVLAVAQRMPQLAPFHTATPGLELRLAQTCLPRTAAFFNELAAARKGLLLAVGDAKFWCFWPDNKGKDTTVCHAFYLAPLSRVAASALDTAALSERLQLDRSHYHSNSNHCENTEQELNGGSLGVRELPPGLAALPVKPFFCQDCDSSHSVRGIDNSIPILPQPAPMMSDLIQNYSSLTDVIAGFVGHDKNTFIANAAVHNENDDAMTETTSTSMDIENERMYGMSGAELQALNRRMERESSQYNNNILPGPGVSTSLLNGHLSTRTDSLTTGRRSSQLSNGNGTGSGRDDQKSFRKRRYERLMQSQRRGKQDNVISTSGVGIATNSNRSKRGRPITDVKDISSVGGSVHSTLSRRRISSSQSKPKKLQQNASTIYLKETIKKSLNALEKSTAFFHCNAATESKPSTSAELADELADNNDKEIRDNTSRCTEELRRKGNNNQGNHGVEYLFEGAEKRDKHITEYENMMSKMKLEFTYSETLNSGNGRKLVSAIHESLYRNRREEGKEKEEAGGNSDKLNASTMATLLTKIVDAIQCGKINIQEEHLAKEILKIAPCLPPVAAAVNVDKQVN